MKKKTVVSLILIVILLVLLVPMPTGTMKDGGTRVYTALTYKVVKWRRLIDENERYIKTSVYLFPDNFNTIDELWKMETSNH